MSSKTLLPETELELVLFHLQPFTLLQLIPSGNISFPFITFCANIYTVILLVSFNSYTFRPNKFSSCHLTFKVVFLSNKATLNIVGNRQHNAPKISQ